MNERNKELFIKLVTGLVVGLLFLVTEVAAQKGSPPDTTLIYEMEQIVVTADRTEGILARSTAAVSVIQGKALRRHPLRSLSDALQLVPGFVFLNSGPSYTPQPTIRGFYGGGEAGYVKLLLNGKPLGRLERGTISWNLIPMEQVDAIEVLRGGASSLYGSAAIGGVINLVMKEENEPVTRAVIQGGTYETFVGQLRHSNTWKGRHYTFFGNLERTNGYRDHAARQVGTLGGSIELFETSDHTLTLSSLHHWNQFKMPGPLSNTVVDSSRRQVATFYQYDNTNERFHRITLDDEVRLQEGIHLSSYITGRLRYADVVRTLSLAPGFADTRSRAIKTTRLQASTQLTIEQLPIDSELTLGLEGSLGPIETRYYNFLRGTEDTYRTATDPRRGELVDMGDGSRNTFAAFFQYDMFPDQRLRLSLGMRFDYLRDVFQSVAPEEEARVTNTHMAFCPKLGINYQYMNTDRNAGNIYANVSKIFKAPTLDQFYDQRLIRMPVENVPLSNPALKPQRGTSFELGTYHRSNLISEVLTAELSLAVYQINMRDEIDFSLQELRYINIGESRHRGIEAGLKLYLPGQVNMFANYTHQAVVLENGPFEGNYVKAIPRNAFSAGISIGQSSGLSGGLLISGANDIYLDDANTIPFSGYTRMDLRLAYTFEKVTVAVDVFNALNREYITTGFPDPSGQTDQVYYYPASGRTIQLGLIVSL